MSASGIASTLLRRHEGFRQFPYRDTVGKLTIGYGLNLEDVGITEYEARYILELRIDRINLEMSKSFSWYNALSSERKAVVIDMVYNLGMPGFMKFNNLRRALADRDWDAAAEAMRDSKWYSQVGQRAANLITIMKTGSVPATYYD